jgi:hypothetical protein
MRQLARCALNNDTETTVAEQANVVQAVRNAEAIRSVQRRRGWGGGSKRRRGGEEEKGGGGART